MHSLKFFSGQWQKKISVWFGFSNDLPKVEIVSEHDGRNVDRVLNKDTGHRANNSINKSIRQILLKHVQFSIQNVPSSAKFIITLNDTNFQCARDAHFGNNVSSMMLYANVFQYPEYKITSS